MPLVPDLSRIAIVRFDFAHASDYFQDMGGAVLSGLIGWFPHNLFIFPSKDLTRFNKIVIPNNKFQMASGQGSHWLIKSPTILSSMCSRPYQISVNSNFKHIHTTSINTNIWQFVPFIYHPL